MSATEKTSCLLLALETSLEDGGREAMGTCEGLPALSQLLALTTARVTILNGAIRVEAYDGARNRVVAYELEESGPAWRHGRFVDDRAGVIYVLRVPGRKTAPACWLMPQEDPHELCVFLGNGLVLRARSPLTLRLAPAEARSFWGDLFWLQPRGNESAFWNRLTEFGLPERVTLESATTRVALVEMRISSARRGTADAFDTGDCHSGELGPLTGRSPGSPPSKSMSTFALGSGAGEHIGWIVAPTILDETATLVNAVAAVCGEFDQPDGQGGLMLDWYQRAAKSLGESNLNAFTRVREVMKSLIALYILPTAVKNGEIPPEMKPVYGGGLQDMFANPAIAPDQRWCAFLSGLKKPAPEFGGPLPTPAQHHDYRQAILQEIVNDVLEKRYAAPAVPKLLPYHWGCWALDFNAHSFRMKLRPGNAVIKGFTITGEGLRLELALDQVTVDCEYSTTPSDSDGNVALCILSFGAANIVELQWGDGTVVARDVCLPLEFVPKRDGGQIKLEAKLGQTFHADLDYFFSTNNMWALGPSLLVSLCLTLSDAFEGTLLEFAAGEVKKFIDPLGLTFPALFHFEDAPPPELDEAVMATNPGVAQLLGARVFLPEERAPVPLPPLVAPASTADFAITLAIDYLNGVLAHRLSQFNEAVPPIVFDWKKYLSGADLPPVKPPEGYEPFNKLAYPGDYEETSEEWAIGSPVFSPGKAVGRPGVKDAIGSVQIPVTYRLTCTLFGWAGDIQLPKPVRAGKPSLPDPMHAGHTLVALEDYLTARYGLYREASGQIASPPLRMFETAPVHVNPSPLSHVMNVGIATVIWDSYPIATDEHINVQLQVTLPAHFNLVESPSFLPSLDLTYGALDILLTKATYSARFPGLGTQPELWTELVRSHLTPFADRHKFTEKFTHAYMNVWPMCGDVFSSFAPDDQLFLLTFTFDTMLTNVDPTTLDLESDAGRIKLNFRFLRGLAN